MKIDLTEYNDQFKAAYRGTSFFPDERAEQSMKEWEEALKKDLSKLPEVNHEGYSIKFIGKLLYCLYLDSICMSSMIAGPAKFPVSRNEKANNAARRGWDDFYNWRERFVKAVNREHHLSPEEELDKALKAYDKQYQRHEVMTWINRILRSKMDMPQKVAEIIELTGWDKKAVDKILTPEFIQSKGFFSFELRSSNSWLKRLEEKVLTMKARILAKQSWEPIPFDGGEIDIQADRVIITHDEKPSRDIIDSMKKRGFRWSSRYQTWSRKHTAQAIIDAKSICGIQ
jgi:hypothetical protein